MEFSDTLPQPIQNLREGGLFAATRWSLVKRAVFQNTALDEWIGLYWYPLYAWARRRGMAEADAADGVQSFLHRLCEKSLLAQADANRGRLRNWLLTAFGNHLRTQAEHAQRLKRGGGAEHLSIDWAAVEMSYQTHSAMIPTSAPEAIYARTWALTLMDEALERVRNHYVSSGRDKLYDVIAPALEESLPDQTYAEAAIQLDTNATALRQAVLRLRQRYRRTLIEIASERLGIQGEARVSAEIRAMLESV